MADRVPDLYAALGVQPTATVEQIKAAYRRQALRHHPDKNPGSPEAEERFKRCTEAFNVLSNEQQRTSYDTARLQAASVPELFGEMIGDLLRSRGPRRRNGRDVKFTMQATFREAVLGVRREICFPITRICDDCGGTGAAHDGRRRCEACDGRGEARPPGLFSLPHACPQCGGQGMRIVRSCRGCAGVGNIEETRRYRVTLPPGTRDGDLRVIAGQGEPGQLGGRPGDLEVRVKVTPHPVLRQQGDDLLVDLPLGLTAAALGGTVEVPTIDGRVRMKIPAGTQSGRLFRLRGMGVPRASGRGDQLVRVEVETPVGLDEPLRERLLAFVEGCDADNEPLQRAFWERVEAAESED